MTGNDLPQAGAQLVLDGVTEFINNMNSVTLGLQKVASGLVQLAGMSTSTSTAIDSASQRIVVANNNISNSGTQLVNKFGQALKSVVSDAAEMASAVEADATRVVAALDRIKTIPNRDAQGKFTGGEPKQAQVVGPKDTTDGEEAHLELLVALEHELALARTNEGHAAAQNALETAKAKQAKQEDAVATTALIREAQQLTTQINNTVAAQSALDAITHKISLQTETQQVAALAKEAQAGAAQLVKLAQAQIDLDNVTKKASAANEVAQVKELAIQASAASKQLELLAQAERDLAAASSRQAMQDERLAVQSLVTETERLYPAVNNASGGSLNFVRAITAMVAANNLLNVGALQTVFNIGTMAASFDRMGSAGLVLGGSIGIVLAAIGSLINAFGQITSFAGNVIQAVVQIGTEVANTAIKIGQSAIKSAADYQQAMAFYIALTGATSEKMEALDKKIFEVAQTTLFSMPKAAEAVNELGRAGASTFDIINKGALDAVVALTTAAGGELQLADAAKSVVGIVGSYTSVINGATTQTVDYTRAANAMTASAQLSRLSFNDVIVAWRQAGPVAASTKISVEDLGAMIAILSNAGESASIAGTSFKQVILDLEKPSQNAAKELNKFGVSLFTAEGAIRPLRDVIIDMNNAFGEQALATGKVTEEEQKHALAVIFGSRAALAANIITNQGVQAFDAMKASMEGVTAVDMAGIMVLPLNARLQILENSVRAIGTEFAGPFVSALSDAVNAGLNFIHSIPIEPIQLFGQALVAVATNQGVDILREKLEEMASGNSLQFFNSLITLASRVQQSITQLIIPAIEKVVSSIAGIAGSDESLDSMARTFDALGNTVLFVGAIIAEGIQTIYDWTRAFLDNKEAVQTAIYIVEGLAAAVAGTLVASFLLAAPPIILVTEILMALGQSIDPLLGHFADLASGAVATGAAVGGSFEYIAESSTIVPEAIGLAAQGAIDGYLAMAEGAVASAEVVVEASNQEADGVLNATDDMVQGQAEGWNNSLEVTKQGVDGIGKTIAELEAPFKNLENAPSNVAPNWSNMLNAAGQIIAGWINQVSAAIADFVNSLASNPIFQGLIAGTPVISSIRNIVVGINTIGAQANAVHTAWDGVNSAVERIGRISVPEITRQTRESSGALRGLLDGIRATQDASRERVLGTPAGRSTEPGINPTKDGGGGGGGKGRKPGGGGGDGSDPFNKALDNISEFFEDVSRTIDNAGTDALDKLEKIFSAAGDKALIAKREYNEKSEAIDKAAAEQVKAADDAITQSRSDRARKEQLSDHQQELAQQRKFDQEDANYRIADRREQDDNFIKQVRQTQDRLFQLSQQDAASRRNRERQDEDTAFKRKLDDEERRLQKLDDLHNKPGVRQTEEDRQKMRMQGGFSKSVSTDEVEKARLKRAREREDLETARNRTRQDEDTIFDRGQGLDAQHRKDIQDKEDLDKAHARRDEDRGKQRQQTLQDNQFAKDQGKERQGLEDQLEDEGLKRRKDKIEQDRIDRQAIQKREFDERMLAILTEADKEAQTVLDNTDKILRGVGDKIKDKMPELLKSGGAAMQPIIDDIVSKIEDQMSTVQEAARSAREELAGALGENVENITNGVVPSMVDATTGFIGATVDFTDAMLKAAQRMADFMALNGWTLPESAPTNNPYYNPQGPLSTSDPSNGNGNGPGSGTFGNGPGGGGDGGSSSGGVGGGGEGGGGGSGGGESAAVYANPEAMNEIGPGTVSRPPNISTVSTHVTYEVNASYANTQSPASISMDLDALSAISRR